MNASSLQSCLQSDICCSPGLFSTGSWSARCAELSRLAGLSDPGLVYDRRSSQKALIAVLIKDQTKEELADATGRDRGAEVSHQ
jgi:hypothetical protein